MDGIEKALFGFSKGVLGFVSGVGKGELLLVVFKNLPFEQNMQFRDVRVYNAAMSGLLLCGRYEDAWKVYESMESSNIRPDHKGVKWSLEAVGALIKSFCDEGLKKEALIIQSELEKSGISSNVVIYNTIMDAYSKSNLIEEAEVLFAEMKVKGVTPTAATHNTLMDAYSRRMQPEIVEKLLQETEANGLKPNVRSYTCLISAYGRQKKMSDMASNAFIFKRGIKARPPLKHTLLCLMHLDELVTLMRDKVEGTRVTFNILVDGFAKQGLYSEARDVVSEFRKLGFHPNVMMYNMLMNGREGKNRSCHSC
ncbi:hypothetical protein ACS0TY_031435 [Phlomoides rotata]